MTEAKGETNAIGEKRDIQRGEDKNYARTSAT